MNVGRLNTHTEAKDQHVHEDLGQEDQPARRDASLLSDFTRVENATLALAAVVHVARGQRENGGRQLFSGSVI